MQQRILVGIRRELMDGEGRVPIFPETVDRLRADLARSGMMLGFMVEGGVGEAVGLTDRDWRRVGTVTGRPESFYESVDIVLGVKQPTWSEVAHLGERPEVQGISCFLHASANRAIVERLLEKEKVKILPLEYSEKSLSAMSREAGLRIPTILDRCYPGGKETWKKENVFLLGARGTVCRHAIDALYTAGVGHGQFHPCDLAAGVFAADDTEVPRAYRTFPIADDDEVMSHLQVSRIVILAAFGRGGAPKVLSYKHLAVLPHKALIVQVTIDEGGNIIEEEFCRPTSWSDPIYEAHLGPKILYVCNIPNIPGCIDPATSSRALEQADYNYYLRLFMSWPDVPEEYLYRGV